MRLEDVQSASRELVDMKHELRAQTRENLWSEERKTRRL